MTIPAGRYAHFKGGCCVVLTTAVHSETKEQMVVYVCLVNGETYVRPAEMWVEPVEWSDGILRPRFVPEEELVVRHSISASLA